MESPKALSMKKPKTGKSHYSLFKTLMDGYLEVFVMRHGAVLRVSMEQVRTLCIRLRTRTNLQCGLGLERMTNYSGGLSVLLDWEEELLVGLDCICRIIS